MKNLDNSPIACSLTSAELRGRKATLLAQFRSAVVETEELQDGYTFRLTDDAESIQVVANLIMTERECCPFLAFNLVAQPNEGPVIVRVTGTTGTKEFLKSILYNTEEGTQNIAQRVGSMAEEAMPRITTQEFERLPLRVHDFLAGVPLHDVWAVDLPRVRPGITLDEFVHMADALACTPSPIVRALVNIRLLIGRLLGWDREPVASGWETFATRLTVADRSKSLVPAGKREGLFRVVYRFENEQLLELINRTAHAGALSALVETERGYHFYFGVYVRSVSRFTPIYMALIDPFRKLVVYPSLLRTVREKWNQTFGTTDNGTR